MNCELGHARAGGACPRGKGGTLRARGTAQLCHCGGCVVQVRRSETFSDELRELQNHGARRGSLLSLLLLLEKPTVPRGAQRASHSANPLQAEEMLWYQKKPLDALIPALRLQAVCPLGR